jgi:hypothetical protein
LAPGVAAVFRANTDFTAVTLVASFAAESSSADIAFNPLVGSALLGAYVDGQNTYHLVDEPSDAPLELTGVPTLATDAYQTDVVAFGGGFALLSDLVADDFFEPETVRAMAGDGTITNVIVGTDETRVQAMFSDDNARLYVVTAGASGDSCIARIESL